MAWAASTIIALSALTVSAGATGYAVSGAGTPSSPNLSSSSRKVSNAEAAMLPFERMLQGAAQSGGSAQTIKPGYFMRIDKDGNTIYKSQKNHKVVPASEALTTTSFAGYGDAETQAAIAKQNAANQIELQQKYAPQFITEALKQEALSDPQGMAARQRESELIQQQIDQPITNPVSEMLSGQVNDRVKAGKGLDDFDTQVLNSSVEKALAARGGSTTPADYSEPLTTGFAGEQRRMQGIGEGQAFLSSGTTPEDVKYRQDQQNLANLSAEVNGATPTSQFASLSNASHSANPTSNGSSLPMMGNAMQVGGNAALANYQQQSGQANSWLGGISSLLSGAGAAAQFV